jgi:putative addiction module CopG family antidote
MKPITIKLDDELDQEIERYIKTSKYSSKSELIRDALRNFVISQRKAQLQNNLQKYLEDKRTQREAADAVENRMAITEEALKRSEGSEGSES